MGDVVLTVPVIQNLQQQYPDVQITLLTKPFFSPFFQGIPNLEIYPVDLKGTHKGVKGLYALVDELCKIKEYDAIIDLHDVLRSRLISFFFTLKHVPVYRIDKGRKEKRAFVKQKKRTPLAHTTERYQSVFQKAGFDISLRKELLQVPDTSATDVNTLLMPGRIPIAIAPFAAHKTKEWGLNKIQSLIEEINDKYLVQFYLLGGGSNEIAQLNSLTDQYENVTNLAGRFSLTLELSLIQKMAVLIAMDSGNMHIASLLGVPVVSIWGGTHPDLGFKALYQPEENSIQIPVEALPCRPCSVYGTRDCHLTKNPFACMKGITSHTVMERLERMGVFPENL